MQLPPVIIKRILYATDLSETARLAFAYAASLADKYNASITIVHVIEEIPDLDASVAGYVGVDVWESIKQSHIDEAKASLMGKKRDKVELHEALDRFSTQVQTEGEADFVTDETLVVRGKPVHEVILHQAEKSDCDLIVMGSHGHSLLSAALMGDTAAKVMRHSKKPVLIVRLPKQ